MTGGDEFTVGELCEVIEASGELLAITDYDGHFKLLNKAWEYALGYTRAELRGKPFMDFVHPDDREKTANIAARIQPGVNLLEFQNRYMAKDGRAVPLRWTAIVSPERQRYYTATRDMSEALAAREQTAAFEALCELSTGVVVQQSPAGTITRWAGAGIEWFGWTAEDVVGRRASELLSTPDGAAIDLLGLLDAGEDESALAASVRHKDGARSSVRVAAREFGTGTTPLAGVLGVITLA